MRENTFESPALQLLSFKKSRTNTQSGKSIRKKTCVEYFKKCYLHSESDIDVLIIFRCISQKRGCLCLIKGSFFQRNKFQQFFGEDKRVMSNY